MQPAYDCMQTVCMSSGAPALAIAIPLVLFDDRIVERLRKRAVDWSETGGID